MNDSRSKQQVEMMAVIAAAEGNVPMALFRYLDGDGDVWWGYASETAWNRWCELRERYLRPNVTITSDGRLFPHHQDVLPARPEFETEEAMV